MPKKMASSVLKEYGDYGKRHHAHKRPAFQQMLADIAVMRPNLILVQRLDRFGVKDSNELGYFLTILEQNSVRLITTIDGQDHSKDDIHTNIMNALAASQSRQEQIDKSDRVLVGKRKTARQGEYIGGKYLTYGFDLVCIGRDGNEKWRLVEESYDCRVKYVLSGGQYLEVERYRQRGSERPRWYHARQNQSLPTTQGAGRTADLLAEHQDGAGGNSAADVRVVR